MQITLETGRWAARYIEERTASINLPEGATVADIVVSSGIPTDEAGIASIGGNAVSRDYRLSDGDVVKLFPVIVGG